MTPWETIGGDDDAGVVEPDVDDEVLERVEVVGLNMSLGAVPPASAGAAGSTGGDVTEFTTAFGTVAAPEFTAASGVADVPESVLERAGLEPESILESILGAAMDGCGTSGGIGGEYGGSSADIGELGCGAVAAAVAGAGDDTGELGCGVVAAAVAGIGDDTGELGCEVVAATGVGALQLPELDELHEIPVKEPSESPEWHCVRPMRL